MRQIISGTLKFGDFTLKSGRQCPYFMNFGSFNTGKLLSELAGFYADLIKESGVEFDVIFGPAYKGIPLAAVIAAEYSRKFGEDKGFAYNRKEAKDHGEGGLLVGAKIGSETKVLIVDDVMTAGTALRESLEVLKKSGNPIVVGVVIAVDRMEKGTGSVSAVQEVEKDSGVKVYSVITVKDVMEKAQIDAETKSKIQSYLSQYGA